ncbi:S8 family peptidase [Ramlibacter sp. AN1133]|uniref:S8 family peptidase n=1 Tax=Ramlibacter sp. AN1133 TaxID=3133429 RepID=UPI0030C38999
MSPRNYAKVVIAGPSPDFEAYRQALAQIAHPQVDVGVLQVGVHEAVLRPHLLLHLQARSGLPVDQVLRQAGATRVELITEDDAYTLCRHRVEEDVPARTLEPVPAQEGGRLWHLNAVNVQPAWQAVGGPDTIDWHDIVVGQIDTGYTHHVAFAHDGAGDAASWIRASACRTFLYPDVPAEYAVLPPPEPGNGVDPLAFGALNKGHGTRIGATISGCARMEDGEMYYGIAPRVPHVIVRITDSVVINTHQQEFVEALDYLVNVVRVDAVNVSLGVFPPVASAAIRAVMRNARDQGVIVCCAAGNYVDPVVVPARLDTAIAVGGVTWQKRPWSGSSFGPTVAFSAPAKDIFRPEARRSQLGTSFAGGGDGTSYATAITTGTAALWLLRWRTEIAQRYGRSAARVEAFKAAARATCLVPPMWEPEPFGAGILDAGRLCTQQAEALP